MSTTETVEKDQQTNTAEKVAEVSQQEAPQEQPESIFKDKKHFPIFPTNLFEFLFKGDLEEKMKKCLPALGKLVETDEPNWVTRPDLNTLEDYKDAASLFSEGAVEVLGFSGVNYDELLITSLKAFRFTKPELVPVQKRANNLLSGIFFLKTDESYSGIITFFDPRPQAWMLKPPISKANIFNSDAFSVEFTENKLLIFPAWLEYQIAFKQDMGENIFFTWTAMVRGGQPKQQPSK